MAGPDAERGRFARLGGPILLALAIAGGLVAMGVLNHRTNRAGALTLAERYVSAVDAVVAREVRDFLTPAETAVRLYAVAIGQNAVASEPDEAAFLRAAAARRLAFEMLVNNPQFAAVFAADAEGRFQVTYRTEEGGYGRRSVAIGLDGRRVIEETLDAAGRAVETRDDPDHAFDPRRRDWFEAASAADGPVWTDVYAFFADGRPGVTAAYAQARDHAPDIVTGVDIRLDDLSRNLGAIGIGETGRAVIVDDAGAVLVAPAALGVAPGATEIDDPLLAQMRDRFRVTRAFSGIVRVGDSWYLAAFSRVGLLGGAPWWLLVAIPESEFARFVQQSNRDSLIVSVVVTALALALAGLLARQSALTDRRARRLAQRASLIDAQAEAAGRMAAVAAASGTEVAARARESARILATTTGARRAAFWRAEADGAVSRLAGWDASANVALDPARMPQPAAETVRAALAAGEAWRGAPEPGHLAVGACADDCALLLAAPVAREGALIGAVLIEDPGVVGDAAGDPETLARVAGAIAAAWLAEPAAAPVASHADETGLEKSAPGRAAPEGRGRRLSLAPVSETAAALSAGRVEAVAAAATRAGLSRAGLDAALFPNVAALTVIFADPLALAAPAPDDADAPLIGALAQALRDRAEAAGAPYVKLLGERAVAATGFDADDPAEPAAALAEMAVALQEDFARLAAGRRGARIARIGLEAGPAMGAALGAGGLALWGEAPTVSALLAETAPPGAVQAGDVAHAALVGRFAFQPRGAFYADGVGELTAYFLRGRR